MSTLKDYWAVLFFVAKIEKLENYLHIPQHATMLIKSVKDKCSTDIWQKNLNSWENKYLFHT